MPGPSDHLYLSPQVSSSPTVSPGVGGGRELSVGSKVEGWVEKPATHGETKEWGGGLRVLAAPRLTTNRVLWGSVHLPLENKGESLCLKDGKDGPRAGLGPARRLDQGGSGGQEGRRACWSVHPPPAGPMGHLGAEVMLLQLAALSQVPAAHGVVQAPRPESSAIVGNVNAAGTIRVALELPGVGRARAGLLESLLLQRAPRLPLRPHSGTGKEAGARPTPRRLPPT